MISRLEIDFEKINELLNTSEYIDTGSFGSVYKYDEDHLIKFENEMLNTGRPLTKEVLRRYLYENDKNLFCCDIEHQQDFLASKQENVKLSTFPKQLLYFERWPVALVLKNHSPYQELADYSDDMTYEEMLRILDKFKQRQKELSDNGIYHLDAENARNILVRPSDGNVEIIDFDGPRLIVDEPGDNVLTSSVTARLYALEKYYAKKFVRDEDAYEMMAITNGVYRFFEHDEYEEQSEKLQNIVKKIGVKK